MSDEFILSEINNLEKRQLNTIEGRFVCIPYELFCYDKYKQNELKFLLHVYIYMKQGLDSTFNLVYNDFLKWINTSKNARTKAKNIKQINAILKEMENNKLIKIHNEENAYISFKTLEQFVKYSKDNFYKDGFVSVCIDEVQKNMDCDTSKYKGVSNGLLLYTYVWLVRRIKTYAQTGNKENPCYYVKEFYCNLCNKVYNDNTIIRNTVQCLQDLGLIYTTIPKKYKKEDGSMTCGATIFALPYIRDCKKGIEYYGENYINSVIEYAERR